MRLHCPCNNVIQKKSNGVSTKMLQSKMLKTSGKQKIVYNNSKTNTILNIIISKNIEQNKSLLLCLQYNIYITYLNSLIEKYPDVNIMFYNILDNLTENEKEIVYNIVPSKIAVIPNINDITGRTYYQTNIIYNIILSQNIITNKSLLLYLKYKAYNAYLTNLVLDYPQLTTTLNQMLDKIINDLNSKDIKVIYSTSLNPIVEYKEGKTYYVVTRKINTVPLNSTTNTPVLTTYFIYKNYTFNDTFLPTYIYNFDISDPSNEGTELAFSSIEQTDQSDNYFTIINNDGFFDNNGIPEGMITRKNNIITLKIPYDFNYNTLYIFNRKELNLIQKYLFSSDSLNSINIRLNAIVNNNNITNCNINTINNNIKYNPVIDNTKYIDRREIVGLLQSSIISGIHYKGIQLYIYNINDTKYTAFLKNNSYGLYNGTYYLYVPQMYELAFLNKNQTNFNYEGVPDMSTDIGIKPVIGTGSNTDGNYNFYYGYIKITITGPFDPISIYTYRYGYLGGYNMLLYSELFSELVKDFKTDIKNVNLFNY